MGKTVAILAVVFIAGIFVTGTPAVKAEEEYSTILTAERISEAITIDGYANESSWKGAKKLVIRVQDGGIGVVDVALQALYDHEYIYLYASWADPTESVTKGLWTFDSATGNWSSSGDEDRFSIFWNIEDSIAGFNIGGCAMLCHGDRMHTNAPHEKADIWHWKASRTNPMGYADDKWMDDTIKEGYVSEAKEAARHGDNSTSGGYRDNKQIVLINGSNVTMPLYYEPNPTNDIDAKFLFQSEIDNGEAIEVTGATILKNGTTVPGYILDRPIGSRGDIDAKGIWRDGMWSLELKRKLNTGHADDVQFEVTKLYRFGVAISDNAGGFEAYGKGHSFDLGAKTLEFGGVGSEEVTQLVLIRDYLTSAKAHIDRGESGLALSEINNALTLYNGIRDAVASKDPALYMIIKNGFVNTKRNPLVGNVDALIGDIDDITLTFQGKREPKEATLDLKFIIAWGKVQLYVFILLALLALYPLYRAIQTGRKPAFHKMSIFLVIVMTPILLEGIGRFGILSKIYFLQNFSFMTNEYATLLWAVLMLCGLFVVKAGFGEVDKNIQSLERYSAELKEKVDEIQRLKEYTENVVEYSPTGIAVINREGIITYSNPVYWKMMGAKNAEEIRGSNVFEIPAFKETAEGCLKLEKGKFISKEQVEYKSPKRDLILSLRGAPLYNKQGEVEGAVLLLEDVTEREKLERQLLQSEKLASIGRLAAGVAHEISNPLTNISLYTEMLLKKADNPKIREKLTVIEDQVSIAASIIRNLLDFSSRIKPELEITDVNNVLRKTLQMVSFHLKNIKVTEDFNPDLPKIYADPGQLQQAFTNIIINGIQAMPDGGELRISTRFEKPCIIVSISDTGHGIAKEHIDKIFDPFFTTKGVGKGVGLGLSVSHRIIEGHEGTIEVESELGKGSTFRIKLPVGDISDKDFDS
jgi:PAS domain S-box-containing protein